MHTSGRDDIKRWVISYFSEAEVLKPDDLRQELKHDIEQLVKKY